ncbi:MAG: tetratricopeptide repeat protein [Polyangiaceae bacterium]|jgi:TolA-binding protein
MAPDLHPEDLIERDERGLLDQGERARLDAHVSQCVACRLTRVARADFEREAKRMAAQIPIDQLIGQLLLPAAEPASLTSRGRRLGRYFAPASLTLLAGLAAASVQWSTGPRRDPPVDESNAVAPSNDRHASGATLSATTARPTLQTMTADVDVRSRPGGMAEGRAILARREHDDIRLPRSASPASPSESPNAQSLFDTATALRRLGDHSRASDVYANLVRRYPESPEAHAALAIFGRMLLDDGNASAALDMFERYLRSGGVLEQDVLVGKALALERLGQNRDAKEVWASLLRSYPGSVHADRARAHMVTLEER